MSDDPAERTERDQRLPGLGLSEAQVDAEIASVTARTKLVVRPGFFQYAYALLVPGFFTAMGMATVAYGLTTQAQDWSGRLPASVFWGVPGLLGCAYVLGMRVEVTGQQVSKIFLFGLVRETIPLDQLAAKVDREYSSGVHVSKAQFMRAQGRGAFSLYRTWIWRGRDVDQLLRLGSRPWDPESSMKRQNGRLIGIVALVGLAFFIAFLIALGNTSPNGSILGIPMH
jgi:hypothetical protein